MLREVGLLLLLAFSAWSIVRYLFADGGPAVFDYIVVGGGSTGAVVAGRLGEAGYSVLVLEAGGSTQISLGGDAEPVAGKWTIFDVPLGWVQVLSDHRWSKEFQWVVPADPPPAIARGLGGCGIHNAMLYMRGRPADFAEWGAGWSWDDVLPFYKRSEDNEQFGSSPLHGTGGPVRVTTVASDELSDFFLDAFSTAGLPHVEDFNGPDRIGAGAETKSKREG
ncbi:putative glucose-methanol-choline oxidoreductase [Emiliania huxleyi CCMP1516]|uniref:Glucose-methanol-choline oxidoreductase N-terminal domain-containing protein n=2 Tax=Emiliania huxleyi TaxID=2903 RepID=A0A0D3JND9_EMIH1|nr:putative glucose-methanol-choline oxidoreductase [Emiliania huxleyi CCMP1516]EOD25024.1 putative glucose-methanol-choline oxidoreductase [Emiliania huxleyi CCMP1516]|eukprot:XP_005777453.1 putative glucose-methanol-choline oxidoreductase [Emiliania huxleyi CCMP1516]